MTMQDLVEIEARAVPSSLATLAALQEQRQDELFAKANVCGVALGHKYVGGQDSGRDALQVLNAD